MLKKLFQILTDRVGVVIVCKGTLSILQNLTPSKGVHKFEKNAKGRERTSRIFSLTTPVGGPESFVTFGSSCHQKCALN